MTDRTAFPWVPKTQWWKEVSNDGKVKKWRVQIVNPEPNPECMVSVRGVGITPRDAINDLLTVVSWWLDYDGRRRGTVGEVYVPRSE